MRQSDVAQAAGVSRGTIWRIERGHVGTLTFDTLRAVARALDVRVDLQPRWRGGDLDRLMNANHSQLHELVARYFRELPDWVMQPEVSFAIYGERGVIDILAFHPGRQALLVIELKTDIVDVNDLVGGVDRKERLALRVAAERGWRIERDTTVSSWVIVAYSRTTERRLSAHRLMLRSAFPLDGRAIRPWLRDPRRAVRCLSLWRAEPGSDRDPRPVRRVQPTKGTRRER